MEPRVQAEGWRRGEVTYRIASEKYPVTDTEIRGLLDGTVKHHYNQGTAYHMRLGRRYSGSFDGQFELKRALVRWPLPPLAEGGRVEGLCGPRLRLLRPSSPSF